jgi:hypothetical protein
MKFLPCYLTEEEEDRASCLMTRRRFLFLGAAAAGAAIIKPPAIVLAEPIVPVIGQWTDYWSVSPIHKPELAHLMATYYTMADVRELEAAIRAQSKAAHLHECAQVW